MPEVLYHRKANGKLLITGEYFVLDGADALAIPTRFGQTLTIEKSDRFHWRSIDETGKKWLELIDIKATEDKASSKLVEILNFIGVDVLGKNYIIKSDFNKDWGLGSSSSLIALLADYFKLNPYELNLKFFRGSGYDIACAFHESPILYSNIDKLDPKIIPVEIPKEIKPYLYFVYLGKKQNSRNAIDQYSNMKVDKMSIVNQISQISESLLKSKDYKDWIYLLDIHETLISKNLTLEKVSNLELKTLPYFSKSLGAWGGDFAMVITDEAKLQIQNQLKQKQFETLYTYNEIFHS